MGNPEVRQAALAAATAFVSSWNGSKGAGNVVYCAQIFEHYLTTGTQVTKEQMEELRKQETG